MTPGGYIAHIPLKYFSDLSLDLFAGKLLRGRVISNENGLVKIELGGARLEAQSTRALVKGDTVTLRVTGITKHGVSLEIVDPKVPLKHGLQSEQVVINHVQSKSAQLASVRENITKAIELASGSAKTVQENSLAESLKNVLQTNTKFDFFFLAVPFFTENEKIYRLELLMKKLKSGEDDEGISARELLFSVATSKLGDISGRVLSVGKQLRVDMISDNKSSVEKLQIIAKPVTESLTKLGYYVSAVSVKQGKVHGPIESMITNDD